MKTSERSPKTKAPPGRSKKILYVRLPCWKIFPTGVVYLADHLQKHGYQDQYIFDMALVAPGERRRELKKIIQAFSPDFIAFSWRNIQTFGPHDASPALETVLNFDYAFNLKDKLKSVLSASNMVIDHIQQIRWNLQFIADAAKLSPDAQVVVGGPAFSTFPEKLIARMPQGVLGVIGEGEDAFLRIVNGEDISRENVIFRENDRIRRFYAEGYFDLASVTAVDYEYIAKIFPGFSEYKKGFIGVQTKRGCPYRCVFCVYNILEGKKTRFRNPEVVATELEQLNKLFGVNKIWFTDAQFCSTKPTVPHAEELLGQIIDRKLPIGWTGYIRVENLTESFVEKAHKSGMMSYELSFTGSQKMVNELRLGYDLNKQFEKFKMIKSHGYQGQQVKLYLPLNAPGETKETLLETIDSCRKIYEIFGEKNVVPWIFFLGIQPRTPLEQKMIEAGYLKKNYNPLSVNPFAIKKLLYNPAPLGPLVGKAHLKAGLQALDDSVGRLTLTELEKLIGV